MTVQELIRSLYQLTLEHPDLAYKRVRVEGHPDHAVTLHFDTDQDILVVQRLDEIGLDPKEQA